MTDTAYQAHVRKEIVATAKLLVAGNLDLVTGCRQLLELSRSIHPLNERIFLPIIGFESETDDYLLGDVRHTYQPAYLEKLDREILEYSDRARPSVLGACRSIIAEFEGTAMHDWTLISILFDWEAGQVSLEFRHTGSVTAFIIAKNVIDLRVPHLGEWGPSVSVNNVREIAADVENMRSLEIEMQSGDIIRLVASDFDLPVADVKLL